MEMILCQITKAKQYQWDESSIKKIKIRLMDINLNWAIELIECIPKEKYGKKLLTQEFNDLLKELRNK